MEYDNGYVIIHTSHCYVLVLKLEASTLLQSEVPAVSSDASDTSFNVHRRVPAIDHKSVAPAF